MRTDQNDSHPSSPTESGDAVLPWSLIEGLVCPYCGGHLQTQLNIHETSRGLADGVLRCDCYEYPVASGIAVLRQVGPVSSTRNEAVELMKHHDSTGALRWLLEGGSAPGVPSLLTLGARRSPWRRFARRVQRMIGAADGRIAGDTLDLKGGFESALRHSRPPAYADYLFHRFANPSLLGAIPPLLVFGKQCLQSPRHRVVDLLCGVGHTSGMLSALFPDLDIVAADADFVNLFLAHRFIAPRAIALCIDAEVPLPFEDGSVDGLLCLDGLHYVRSKTALLEEVDRVVSKEGSWLFLHLHNACRTNVNPGAPLSAEGYATRFGFGQARLLSEQAIMEQFRTRGLLDLTEQPTADAVGCDHAFILFGGRTDALWRRHVGLADTLRSRPGLLGFNPIYHVEKQDGGMTLTARWPSDGFRDECTRGGEPLIPTAVQLPAPILDEIASAQSGGPLQPDVEQLIRDFVLVPLPACYPRTALPAA